MLHVLRVETSAVRANIGLTLLSREFLTSPERVISGPPMLSLVGGWWETSEHMVRGTGHGYEWKSWGIWGRWVLYSLAGVNHLRMDCEHSARMEALRENYGVLGR